ncbi:DUF2793 domain-containing protein [Microbulbifer sp. DLAB2-AF]|uniref:DUF2793 domain-containing protein n=1 Tax=Microbulbifer sp. DLAB2-AF TaxID=3243395 RepID=UPI004039E27C
MSNTPNNGIPYAQEGTLGPAVSLNQALDAADALLQLEVQAIQNDPPASAIDDDRYLVATGTGAWSGKDGQLARYVVTPSSWQFFPAKVALNKADSLLYVKANSGWQIASRPATLPVISGVIWPGWWGKC